jgi:hypothetical protein
MRNYLGRRVNSDLAKTARSGFLGPREARLRVGLLIACASLLAGCAAEGPPHPPRVQRPVKVEDLKVRQFGERLRLSFTTPRRTTDGRRLTKPIEVRIFRQVIPAGEHTPIPFVPAKPWVSLAAASLVPFTRGNQIDYEDRLSAVDFGRLIGAAFSFQIITLTRGFRGRVRESDPSNVARIRLLNVSLPVQNLRVTPTPEGPRLSWSRPQQGAAGGELPALAAYRIYRSTSGELGPYVLVGRSSTNSFLDPDFQFNHAYFYRVRAEYAQAGYTAESASSQTVTIIPQNIFPPPVPTGLTAVYTGRAVELLWKPDAGNNVAGYNAYRREGNSGHERLNRELLRAPFFTDASAAPNRLYSYWVTAVSLTRHESARSAIRSVETR